MINNKKVQLVKFTFIISVIFMMFLTFSLSAKQGETGPLTILLTNDDGYNAPGLVVLRNILIAAGHNVTVVAPLQNQSGSGGAMSTSMTTEIQEKSPGVWAVDSTPVVAGRIGLDVIMANNPPDLVISGMNFGQNFGERVTISSGTVCAAVSAMYENIPAIAVNVGFIVSEAKSVPPFPSTNAALPLAANFLVDLIKKLQLQSKDGRLLPEHVMLNINFPVPYNEIKGVALTNLGQLSFSKVKYIDPYGAVANGGGKVVLSGGIIAGPDPDENAEFNLYSQGYITMTIMDGDMTAKTPTYNSLKHLFFDLQPYNN